jgi:hypothetical protein
MSSMLRVSFHQQSPPQVADPFWTQVHPGCGPGPVVGSWGGVGGGAAAAAIGAIFFLEPQPAPSQSVQGQVQLVLRTP